MNFTSWSRVTIWGMTAAVPPQPIQVGEGRVVGAHVPDPVLVQVEFSCGRRSFFPASQVRPVPLPRRVGP